MPFESDDVSIAVADVPMQGEDDERDPNDPEVMLDNAAESLAPGALQVTWTLGAFETPSAKGSTDVGALTGAGGAESDGRCLMSSSLEDAFQAQMSWRRLLSWITLLSVTSFFSFILGLAGIYSHVDWENPSHTHTNENMVVLGCITALIVMTVVCHMDSVAKCHNAVRWGNELCFGFFVFQHIYVTYFYYDQEHLPTMNQIGRTVGVMFLLPFSMALLASTRLLTLISLVGNLYVVLRSHHSGYANNLWVTSGTVVIAAISYFSMRKDREGFAKLVELHISRRKEKASWQQRVAMTVEHAKLVQARTEREAFEQQKAYQKIVAATAHDLRTASSALQSGCRVLTNLNAAAKKTDPSGRKKESQIVESMSAMAKVSNGFLEGMTLSAQLLDGSAVPVSIQQINLWELVEEAIACAKLACSGTGRVEHSVVIDPRVSETIYSDLNVISRNLMNFISNASKHTADGSIQVIVSLEETMDGTGVPMDPYVELAVRDTGSGVAAGATESIFEPFVSFDDSTGLGLFVVRRQSEALRGSCGLRNNPEGRGAEFWFRVPYITTKESLERVSSLEASPGVAYQLHSETTEGINVFCGTIDEIQCTDMKRVDTSPSSPTPSDEANGVSQTILLIDDNASLLQIHAAELACAGHTVTSALGGTQGLEFLKLKPYDLVLIDIKMPAINGDELVAAFRHWERHNRPTGSQQMIYALSAYTNADVQERCKAVGMAGVVAKPLRIETIVGLLSDLQPTVT